MDRYVTIEIKLENSVLLTLALEAHKRDITLNQFVNQIIKEHLLKEEENGS